MLLKQGSNYNNGYLTYDEYLLIKQALAASTRNEAKQLLNALEQHEGQSNYTNISIHVEWTKLNVVHELQANRVIVPIAYYNVMYEAIMQKHCILASSLLKALSTLATRRFMNLRLYK